MESLRPAPPDSETRLGYLKAVLLGRIGFVGLGLAASMALQLGCKQEPQTSGLTRVESACIKLIDQDEKAYNLSYSEQKCVEQLSELPLAQYEQLDAWIFNAGAANILSPTGQYRLWARLATRDPGGRAAFSLHELRKISDFHWVAFATRARMALGRSNSPDLLAFLDQSLIRAGLATATADGVRFAERRLDDRERHELMLVLTNVESRFSPAQSTEESQVVAPGTPEAWRKTLSLYRIERR